MHVPFEDIRLVYTIAKPEGGLEQVIVEKMRVRIVEHGNYKELLRYIPGIDPPQNFVGHYGSMTSSRNRRLGYPIRDRSKDDKKDDEELTLYECDTQRLHTEADSWLPSLEQPPFDPSILDELRGKFSKFRIRHDEQFIQEKLEDDRRERLKKQSATLMQSPRATLLEAHSKSAKKSARIEPSSQTLVLLGRYMANHRTSKTSPPASSE
jgi:hypothetical protein